MDAQRIPGYPKKPWWVYALALSYGVIPIMTLVQFGLESGFSKLYLKNLVVHPYFLVEAGCALTAALSVLVVTRFTFGYFVGLGMVSVGLRVFDLASGSALGTAFDVLLLAFWLGVTSFVVATRIRAPYLNPELRWWTQSERVRFVSRGALGFRGLEFPIVTLNLSAGGAFAKLDERLFPDLYENSRDGRPVVADRRKRDASGDVLLSKDQISLAREQLDAYPTRLGEIVHVRIQTLPDAANATLSPVYECDAEIVWSAPSDSPYRFGLGLRFVGRSRAQRRALREYLKLLEQIGFPTRKRTS